MVHFWKIITATAVLLSLSYARSNGLREGSYHPTGKTRNLKGANVQRAENDNSLVKSWVVKNKRRLKQQENDGRCQMLRDSFYDERRASWVVTEAAETSGGLSEIVKCTRDNDTVNITGSITSLPLQETIMIDKAITITTSTSVKSHTDGTDQPAAGKTKLTCPDEDSGVFDIRDSDVVLENLIIHGCDMINGAKSPITVRGLGKISLLNVEFRDNRHISGKPSALSFTKATGSSLTMTDVVFEKNGGGSSVVELPQTVEMTNVKAIRNKAKTAVFKAPRESNISVTHLEAVDNGVTVLSLQNASLSLSGSNFTRNRNSESAGGALRITDGCAVTIWDCRFKNNEANDGGAVYVTDSDITIIQTIFKKQKANNYGAGCFFRDAVANVTACTFEENHSDNDAGAIRAEGGSLLCQRTEFLRNSARNTGGCLKLDRSKTLLKESNFTANRAIFGAVFRSENSIETTTVSGCKIEDNVAENTGGACAFDADIFTIKDSKLKNNSAAYGSAVFAQKSRPGSKIVNTIFEGNHATLLGGVGLLDFGNLTLHNVTFTKNRAYLGGGFYFLHMSVVGSELVFIENSASEGGAFAAVGSNISIRPRTLSTERTTSFGMRAIGNIARNGGGAVQVDNTTLLIDEGEFVKCSGVEGGAIRVLGGLFDVFIKNSKFSDNRAEESGGSVYARADSGSSANLSFQNVSFHKGTSLQGGGACYLSSVDTTIRDCEFQECSSMYGGALLMRKGSTAEHVVKIINSTIHKNSVTDSGGGIYVVTRVSVFLESTIITANKAPERHGGGIAADNSSLSLTNVRIEKNKARTGGGIAALNGSEIAVRASMISDNSAASGGGVFLQEIADATIQETQFRKNEAAGKGGGVLLKKSLCRGDSVHFVGNSATNGGGLAVDQNSSVFCSRCNFVDNKAKENGGGIHAKSTGANNNEISAWLDRCAFSDNRAIFGGGIYYRKLTSPEDRDVSSREQNAKDQGIVLVDASFSGNAAKKNGSAVHSSRKSLISVFCLSSATSTSRNTILKPEKLEWIRVSSRDEETCRRDAIKDDKKAASFTTYVRKIRLDSDGLTNSSSNIYQLSEIVSGSVLPPITVTPHDDYGQFPALSLKDDLSPKLKGDKLVGGVFAANLNDNGSYSFSGIRTNVMKPGEHRLVISFPDADELDNLTIMVVARECHVGEMQRQDGVYCEECSSSSYTFSPEESTCSPCPANANCTGSFIFPQRGYWLNSPCHNRTVECLNPEACDGTAVSDIALASEVRSERLYQFTEQLNKMCPVTETDQVKFRQLQCRQGYEGVLCGQCSEGHGLTSMYTCANCLPKPALVLLLVLAAGWIYLVACITLHGSYIKSRALLKDIISQQSSQESMRTIRRSSTMRTNSRKSQRSRSENVSQPSGSESTVAELPININSVDDIQKEREALLAKWQMCEILKIVVNFLQATSVAVLINVEWKRYILELFRGSDLASGSTVETISNAIHCLSPQSVSHPSVTSTLTVLFGPFLIALTFAIFYFAIAMGGVMNKTVAAKHFVLSFFAILYFNYSNITRQSLTVFLCIGVPDNDFTDIDSMRYVWAQDTSLECKEGRHGVLIAVASLFIGVVSFGFPIVCSLVHYAYKKRNLDFSGNLYDIMGFMFRAYDCSYPYWESLIMLRKACLSLVAVFSYRLGGTTQGLLASAMLITCLFLHTMCRPFRDEFRDLNKYESYSLIVSCMTYLLAGFFVDDRASEGVKLLLSACLMAMISGFILLMSYVFIKSTFWFMEADLQTANIDSFDASLVGLVFLWLAYRTGYKKARPMNNATECEMTNVS